MKKIKGFDILDFTKADFTASVYGVFLYILDFTKVDFTVSG